MCSSASASKEQYQAGQDRSYCCCRFDEDASASPLSPAYVTVISAIGGDYTRPGAPACALTGASAGALGSAADSTAGDGWPDLNCAGAA